MQFVGECLFHFPNPCTILSVVVISLGALKVFARGWHNDLTQFRKRLVVSLNLIV